MLAGLFQRMEQLYLPRDKQGDEHGFGDGIQELARAVCHGVGERFCFQNRREFSCACNKSNDASEDVRDHDDEYEKNETGGECAPEYRPPSAFDKRMRGRERAGAPYAIFKEQEWREHQGDRKPNPGEHEEQGAAQHRERV